MEDPTVGNVGIPLPSWYVQSVAVLIRSEIRLADVPEMKYLSADNKGEVCIRGLSVFSGYYKDDEKTYV